MLREHSLYYIVNFSDYKRHIEYNLQETKRCYHHDLETLRFSPSLGPCLNSMWLWKTHLNTIITYLNKWGSGFLDDACYYGVCSYSDLPESQLTFELNTINPNKQRVLLFYTLFEKRPYINYVRRIQVYTWSHQSINGVVNITLKIWYYEEDRCMTKEYLQPSHMIYLYWDGYIHIYMYMCIYIHMSIHTHTYIHIYVLNDFKQKPRRVFLVVIIVTWEWRMVAFC